MLGGFSLQDNIISQTCGVILHTFNTTCLRVTVEDIGNVKKCILF